MPTPDIDFKKIRLHDGSRDRAFEELCCQLAWAQERPKDAAFTRKGRGRDGGVECYAAFSDGTETGWQVKYSWAVDNNLEAQLDKSLDAALKNHPQLTRYVVCLPFNLSDPRATGVTTQLKRWERWVDRRVASAATAHRSLTIERWDESTLIGLLTADEAQAGRILFWFDDQILTPSWFEARLAKSIADLGHRYSVQTNIALPIRRAITAVGGDPDLKVRLWTWAAELDRARLAIKIGLGRASTDACHTLRATLDKAAKTEGDIPVADAIAQTDAALSDVIVDLRRYGPYDASRRPISSLADVLTSIARALRRPEWTHANDRRLLVTGEAGRGKSHLLADACAEQIARSRPAVLLLGGRLIEGDIWSQIRTELDLPSHVGATALLGALDAAGRAAGCRSLLVIDALNERHGQDIWPERLAGFLHDVEAFTAISVVVSCRTAYLDVVIPSELDHARLPRLDHEGFGTLDAEAYLAVRGVAAPMGPYPIEEFRNPLFLKTCCDGLQASGETSFPRGSDGVSALFDMYASAIGSALTRRMRLTPRLKLVDRAIAALAEAMANAGVTELPYGQADALVEEVYASSGDVDRNLTFQLESESVLVVERVRGASGHFEEQVRFTFERFSDHVVARGILDRSVTSGDALAASRGATELAALLANHATHSRPGVLEALAVQLPERYGVELLDLAGLDPFDFEAREAFFLSLRTREGRAFTARTLVITEHAGGREALWEALLAVACEPDNPYNAAYLDAILRQSALPERDGDWTIWLNENGEGGHAIIDWALRAGWRDMELARAELAAIALAWLLTASDRRLRDRATKALVAVLAIRPGLAHSVFARFSAVDDPYVSERVTCALYGAAMQGRWPTSDLAKAAQLVFDGVLSPTAALAVNILTRDHARGLIAYADHRAALPSGLSRADAEGPYLSAWPLESVPDHLIEGYTRVYRTGKTHTDEIVGSCVNDGDFARYVIDPAVRIFSPAPRGSATLPSSDELRDAWMTLFNGTATAKIRAALTTMLAELAAAGPEGSTRDRAAQKRARERFSKVAGEAAYESWRESCDDWRTRGMYPPMSRGGPASFNFSWARRWVAMRAHQLGWSETLHGDFDQRTRLDRRDHRVERIGKKYQWIALYELKARMADNLVLLNPRENAVEPERLRNLDPSLLIDQSEELRESELDRAAFWAPSPDLSTTSLREARVWLLSDRDLLDGADSIAVVDPASQRQLLVLSGFAVWEAPGDWGRRDMWRRITSIVVRRADCAAALDWLRGKPLLGDQDLPSGRSFGMHSHLGEHAWVLAHDPDLDWETDWASHWDETLEEWTSPTVPARGVTSGYLAEASGFDQSILETVSARLPAPWLIGAMGIALTDGRSFAYADAAGEVMLYDPSASERGHSAALVDRAAFAAMLDAEGLACIWAIGGEKNLYSESGSDGFGGRVTYTRLHVLEGGELTGPERMRTFEPPTFRQLRRLVSG